ncbi:hypothetical protein HYX13_02865 [Candidatus Woesearchaeota archaeon]|nr:hypothetical protein [Candidatus Woesearchaeota archaeon]
MFKKYFALPLLALSLSCASPTTTNTPAPFPSPSSSPSPFQSPSSPASIEDHIDKLTVRMGRELEELPPALQEIFEYCSNQLSFTEKIDSIFTHLIQEKYRKKSGNDQCPEYAVFIDRKTYGEYVIARVPHQESCITEHQKEIIKNNDMVKADPKNLAKRQLTTSFHHPVSYGLVVAVVGQFNSNILEISATFPDVRDISSSPITYFWTLGGPIPPLPCAEHPLNEKGKHCPTFQQIDYQLSRMCFDLVLRERISQ